jgi:hypothetical protein
VKNNMVALEPTAALRRLCAEPAAEFGARLLARSAGSAVPFRAFVQVARDMVHGDPDDAATWLAALVALDMCRARVFGHEPEPLARSPN